MGHLKTKLSRGFMQAHHSQRPFVTSFPTLLPCRSDSISTSLLPFSLLSLHFSPHPAHHLVSSTIPSLPLHFQDIQRLIGEIARGLSILHSHGLIHKNIAPRNVFIFHKKHFKLGFLSSSLNFFDISPFDTQVSVNYSVLTK